ncbi:MAG: methyltransferase domain-containing protein, partial [Anaerolineae bacterium]|nr:methyltransferase domain-containing protein [Anaerolineae bacterium]
MAQWFENDRFWLGFQQVIFTPERMQMAPLEVELIVQRLGLTPGMHILDLGCGVGRHSLEFARRGYHVTGLDRTTVYLEQARAAAQAENLDIEFVQSDMLEFSRENAFDAVISMYSTFGYYTDPAENQGVARNMHHSLKPGGAFLIDMHGKETLAAVFRGREWYRKDDLVVLEEVKLLGDWERVNVRWILFDGTTRLEEDFTQQIWSASEMRTMLTEAGFGNVTFFG